MSRRIFEKYQVWITAVALPLWLGWSFSTIAHLEHRDLQGGDHAAELAGERVRAKLGDWGNSALIVTVEGGQCTCMSGQRLQAWNSAVEGLPGRHVSVELPGAPFSTLVFDSSRTLRFAGSPISPNCGGQPETLLAQALWAPSGQPLNARPCYC